MTSKFKLQWPVDNPNITQRFGENPQNYAEFGLAGHEGIDFGLPTGSNVYACADGEVIKIQPTDDTEYGIHICLRHRAAGREYRTIYAHLSRVLVSVHQSVRTGERIALSGDTGNSTAPHLHLTLKLIGAENPGYGNRLDPLPYLREVEIPEPSDLTVYTTDQVRLRADSTTNSARLAWLDKGEALTVLGDAGAARAKVGRRGQWIRVRRADGMDGYVAAWYAQLEPPTWTPPEPMPEPVPAGPLIVYATEALNVRRGSSTGTSRVAIALPNDPLTAIGDREDALERVGDRGEWLQVRLPDATKGYVAAWYVGAEPGPAPETLLTVYPTRDMNMRERPTIRAKLAGQPAHNAPLTVHDDAERARVLVGRYDEWLYVETEEGQRGWVAAWYVSTTPA